MIDKDYWKISNKNKSLAQYEPNKQVKLSEVIISYELSSF